MEDKNLKYLEPSYKEGREKIEAIENILYRVNKYIRSPEELSDNFVTYINSAISLILKHSNVSGQKGDELASDLIFRCTKLFMNFTQKRLYTKKSVATNLYKLIKMIFNEYYNYAFFITKEKDNSLIKTTHKGLTYEDYNKFFGSDFLKQAKETFFSEGQVVDIYALKGESENKMIKKTWIRGKILSLENENYRSGYNIHYHKYNDKSSNIKFPKSTLEVEKIGKKTEYLENKFNLFESGEKPTVVDFYYEKNNQKIWGIAKITGFDSKDDELKFIKYKLECENIENNISTKENERGFYEQADENGQYISSDSYRIQSVKTFSDVQKKYSKLKEGNEKTSELTANYKSLLDFVLDILENDQNIEDFYEYQLEEKDTDEKENKQKINYILGKYEKNYSFYFSKLLKAMADNEHFKIIKDILSIVDENKSALPTIDEIETFFCILLNCVPFIHKKYYEDNYEIFENAVFRVIKNESEKNNMKKSIFYYFAFFLIKISFLNNKYKIDRYDVKFNLNEEIDKILLKIGLELMKSGIYQIREIGLDIILECVDYSIDDDENIFILNILTGKDDKKKDKEKNENDDFIHILFNKNYQTQFITNSYNIIKLMINNKKLDETKLGLIWNFVSERNDSELEEAVIDLFMKIYDDKNLDSNSCKDLLEIILKEENLQNIDSLYKLKNKLALTAYSTEKIERIKIECCKYFTEEILKGKSKENFKENIDTVKKYFSFGEKFYVQIIQLCINNLVDATKEKNKDKILNAISSFHKILENQKMISDIFQNIFDKNKIIIDGKDLNEELFIKIFNNSFTKYKEIVKGKNFKEEEKEKETENIKIFIDFLMKILPDICKNKDYEYIDLLIQMSLNDPLDEANTKIFYDYIGMFVNDTNKYKDSNKKLEKEKQIFDIINKSTETSNLTKEQIKLYIKIFIDISNEILIKEEEKIKFKKDIKIDFNESDEKLKVLKDFWNKYLNINNDELSKELYLFLYELYNNSDEGETLLKKCLNGIYELKYINDDEEIEKNDRKLAQYINMIYYIISKSEEGKIINIKSHRDISKECIMNIPILLNNNTSSKFDESIEEKIDLFYGNSNLYELNHLLHNKYSSNASDIDIKIIDKYGNTVEKSFNSTLNSLEENSEKIIFVGNEIISLPFFEKNKEMNPKFKAMLGDWFKYFSNDKEKMDYSDIQKFKNEISNKEIIIDNNKDIGYITKEDFIKLYEKLSRDEPDFVRENIKKMKYLNNFEKIQENKQEKISEKENSQKYILGNDKKLYNSLLKIFSQTKKKYLVYEFLNTLCTNEKIYDEILDNFEKISEDENEKNTLEYSYELTIIESMIQDLEVSQLNISDIFKIKKNELDKIQNLERKKKFILTFIKKGNNYINKLLDKIDDICNKQNEIDYDFYTDLFIKILKIVDFLQNIFDQKLFYEINDVINSVYYLNGHNKINKDEMLGTEIQIEDDEISNFNIVILKLFKLFFSYKDIFGEKTYKYIFNILLNTKNFDETIEVENQDEYNEEEEPDELNIYDLLNNNINNNINYNFMVSFEQYTKRLTTIKKEYNKKIEDDSISSIVFDVAPAIIMNIITNFYEIDFDNLDSNVNYLSFFGNLIRLFSVNIDFIPLKEIIEYIESYLQDKNYIEKLYFGLLCLLSALLSCEKQKILSKFNEKINNIYESIKKIILEENIINKAKMKLDELLKNKNKMLPSKTIKEFFDYINNKTEGENILEQTFLIYKNFIISFCDNSSLAKIINKLLENIENFKGKKDISSQGKIMGLMGLTKNENVFYINSILQQLYQISIFRDAIISIDINEKLNNDEMIKELQRMFIYMKYSENKFYDSTKFCFGFIEEMFSREKREGITFLNLLFSQVEESLKKTSYKYVLEDTFQITECISSKCCECGFIEDKFDKYNIITLDIKGYDNLEKALQHRFSENEINDQCRKCRKKTKKIRKASISKLPNVLIFHLDRIHDNYEYGGKLTEKVDDRFEFNMRKINLKENKYKNLCIENNPEFGIRENSNKIYKREDNYYKYNMKGIINYAGNADYGDYFSLVRLENDDWVQFSDNDYSVMEDENTVKLLSYGNKDEIGFPSAYLLIYEREKEYPIRILSNKKSKEAVEGFDNNYISFKINVEDDINKKYDMSRILDENEAKIDIKKLVFHQENLNETFSKFSYEEMEKQIPKILFVQVIDENNKYFRKNDITEYKKCEFKFRLIILDAINSKDFFIFDNKDFSLANIKKLIYFFNKQIFEDKLNEIKNINSSSNKQKNQDFKKYINIFIEKLIIPMLDKKNKSEEIYDLISIIANIFLSKENVKILLEFDKNKRIFDDETVKKFLNVIYKIIKNLIDKENYNKNFDFKEFFKTFLDSIIKYNNNTLNSLTIKDDEHCHHNLLSLYENLKRLIELNNDIFSLDVNILLKELSQIKYQDLRQIIYEIISIIIKNSNNKEIKLKEVYLILNEKLLKKMFNENPELLSDIIIRINYKDFKEKNHFNEIIIPSLFNYALKRNQLKNLLDILFKIINIKDEFILERLYLIMGFPQMIIERINRNMEIGIKKEKDEEESEDDEDEEEEEDDEIENNNNTINDNEKVTELDDEKKNFWPKFGIPYTNKYNTDEIYKYISNFKIYESHCILAQLFPCSKDLYDNLDFIKGEQELDDNEANKYRYKLLSLALLNEGNYCLFKYIYLTPSRHIIDYKNLYEEIINILSNDKNDNNFDLNEIKKNAEICIKRINYEIGNSEEKDLPELPENMKKTYKEFDCIKQFKGFIPKHIPDKIIKVVYSVNQTEDDFTMLYVNYYTTYMELETFRKKSNKEKIEVVENKNKKENNDDEEEDEYNNELYSFDIKNKKIGENEDYFLKNFSKISKKINSENIQITNNSTKNNKPIKSALIRHIYYNKTKNEKLIKDKVSEEIKSNDKFNYFIPELWNIEYIKRNNYDEIFNTYRRNYEEKFVKGSRITHDLYILDKNKMTFSTESYFHDEKK